MKTNLFYMIWIGCLVLSFQFVWGQVKAQDDEDIFAGLEDDVPAIASYDLEGCIEYAFQYSEIMRRAKLDVEEAAADIGIQKATGLPTITGQANYTHNLEIQKAFAAASSFASGQQLPPDVLRALDDSIVALNFATKYIGNASIDVEQLLFDFSYLRGLKSARLYENVQRDRLNLSKIDIAEQVSKAYYGVLVTRERLILLEQNYRRLDTLLRETKALNENGFAEKIDVMRTEVAYNNIQTELRKAQAEAQLSVQVLKFQMGMPLRDSLILEGNIREIALDESALVGIVPDPKSRLEYEILNKQESLQNINLAYNRSLYYPSLRANFSLGANTGTNNFGDVWQFRDRWFGYSFYGISLKVPIMDGFRKKYQVRKVKLNLERIEQDRQEFVRGVNIAVEQSRTALYQSLEDLQSQERNMELAAEVNRVTKIKYENGVGSNREVIDAETDYREAETNYYVALYQALVNKVDLDKALGRLSY